MKRCVLISLGVPLMILFSNSCIKAEKVQEIPPDLVSFAQEELKEYLKIANRERLESMGWLLPEDDIEDVKLGIPYPSYKLDVPKLNSIDKPSDFNDALTLTAWRIPVYFNNDPRTLIQVMRIDGKWKRVSYGGDPDPVVYVRSKWPTSEGYSHFYVGSLQGPDLMVIDKEGKLLFYPFNLRNETYLDISKGTDGRYPIITFKKLKERVRIKEEIHIKHE